jgi:hypothetical protein
MPTPLISENWPRFVLPIVRREWFQHMTAVPSPVANLFAEETSQQAVEYSVGIGDMGLIPEYNSSTAEGAPAAIQYGGFNPLYETTFTHKEYAKGLAIERKLWDDARLSLIMRRAATLGNAYGATIASFQSGVFNNAFAATVVGGDAVALSASAHPTSPTVSTAISNYGTTALSYAAINTVQAAGFAMKADDGTPMPQVYDTLLVPGALQATALEVTKGSYVPGQADFTASAIFYGQGLKVIVDPYLTDANNWFMIDSVQAKLHLLWFWRVRPEMSMDPASDFNLVAKYRTYMRCSFGWDDWRWIYGEEVT